MRSLGFRSLLVAFADLGPATPPEPERPFTVASIAEAVKELEANATPPARCSKCGAGYYLLNNPSRSAPATHWQCECGKIERLVPWQRGEHQVVASAVKSEAIG